VAIAYLLISLDDRAKRICEVLRSEVETASAADGSAVAFVHQPSDQEISSAVRTLLSRRASRVRGLELRLVGELLANGTLARASALTESLSRLVSSLLPGLPAGIEFLMLVPHEAMAWTAEARAFLAGHQGSLVWLVSPFNGQLFRDEELDALCVRFLALDISVDLPTHLWGGERPRAGIASFGLSGLVVPAEAIVDRAAHRLAAEVLTLLASSNGAGPGRPTGDQWLSMRRLRFGDLVAAIGQGTEIPLGERERKVVLRPGEERTWPDRLWSVFYFFGFEGLGRQQHRIANNRDMALTTVLKALEETLHDLVTQSRTPAQALRFLEEVAQAAAAERGQRMEVAGARDHLRAAIEKLKEAYMVLPSSLVGLALRVWAGAFAAAYPLHLLMPTLWPAVRGHLLVSFWGLWLLLGAAGSAVAALFYLDRHGDFVKAKLSAEGTLWKALDFVVTARVHNGARDVLNTVICAAASPAQREELHVARDSVPSLYDLVAAYVARLHEASKLARQEAEKPIVTAPLLSLPTRTPPPVGDLHPEVVADRLVADSFHRLWRDAGAEQLTKAAAASITRMIGISTIPTVADAFPEGPEASTLVHNLLESARPLLALSAGGLPPRRLVFARGGAGSPVARRWRELDPNSTWKSFEDPRQLLVLSVVHGIAAGDLLRETPLLRARREQGFPD